MKKIALLLALAVAFSLSVFAQDTSGTGSTAGSGSDTKATSKTGKTHTHGASSSSADTSGGASAGADTSGASGGGKAAAGKAGKKSTLTGCLSSDSTPYKITNARYKDGVEVATTEDLKAHNGHKVKASGTWDNSGGTKKFNATKVSHVSETCTPGGAKTASAGAGAGGGGDTAATETKGKKGKGKKSSGGDTTKAPS